MFSPGQRLWRSRGPWDGVIDFGDKITGVVGGFIRWTKERRKMRGCDVMGSGKKMAVLRGLCEVVTIPRKGLTQQRMF